jgi:hypothetical protein
VAPFEVLVRGSDPEGRGYDVSASGDPSGVDRYRGLEATELVRRDRPAGPRVYGELTNGGTGWPAISAMAANAVFWQGEDVVRIEAVSLPRRQAAGPAQTLAPGGALPFGFPVPDVAHDRYDLWWDALPQPAHHYAVPLEASAIQLTVEDRRVDAAATIRNCGFRPVTEVVVVVVGRDANARIEDFAWQLAEAQPALGPQRAARLTASWPDAPWIAAAGVRTLAVHAVDTQPLASPGGPCGLLWGRALVPRLFR